MPTTKERILITLSPSASKALRARAKREKTPRATIAARFVEQNLAEIPTVILSPEGERRALIAIRAAKRAKKNGTVKRLTGSLSDLM